MTAEQETHQGVTMKVCNLLINFIFSGLVERRFGQPPPKKGKNTLWPITVSENAEKLNLTAKASTNVHNN